MASLLLVNTILWTIFHTHRGSCLPKREDNTDDETTDVTMGFEPKLFLLSLLFVIFDNARSELTGMCACRYEQAEFVERELERMGEKIKETIQNINAAQV